MDSSTTQKEAFDMLKQMGTPVTQQSLVYYASNGADANILHLLLRAGLDPNKTWTRENKKSIRDDVFYPLLEAVKNGTTQTIEILLNNGADVNIQDANTKETALYLAQKLKKDAIVQLLKNAGAKELTGEEMDVIKKKVKRKNIIALVKVAVFLICFGGCFYSYMSSSSSSGSISSSQKTHTCTWCHKQYTGAGYYHIEDQCTSTNASYDLCCSEKCCMESWNASHR